MIESDNIAMEIQPTDMMEQPALNDMEFSVSDEWDPEKSGLISYAKRELTAVGYDLNDKEEGPNKWMVENVLELLSVFARQGHSGFSAPYCVDLFSKLASYKPLCPLTGEDNEWTEVGENVWQNKRCYSVFKEADGKAYDSNGIVFTDKDGCSYTSRESRVFIEFPYTPTVEYRNDYEENE